MGLFDRMSEKREQMKALEKHRLMCLSEKELMVEIILELRELNRQGRKISRNQVIWSD